MNEQMRMNLDGVRKRCCQLAAAAVEAIEFFNDIEKELNEEREDYGPAEPLIKDEKIRKAVRAWAEAVGKSDALIEFDESANSLWCNSSRIQFDNVELKSLKNWQKYTITELCGEEEE